MKEIEHVLPFKNILKTLSSYDSFYALDGTLKLCNQKNIFKNLSWISKFAFDKDFLLFKKQNKAIFEVLKEVNPNITNSPNHLLKLYTKYLESPKGYQQFIKKHPLLLDLEKQYLQRTNRFIKSIKEHYQKDIIMLSKLMNKNKPLGTILHIELGLGDLHQHGKSVAILTLEGGNKIVYKPRSGNLDVAFNKLLDDINTQIDIAQLKTSKIYSNKDYFWMEYIEHTPCNTPEDLDNYYTNAGILLGLVYLLRGTDMHFENIIAHGKSPVLIDTECLFSRTDVNHYNVLNIGLIPMYTYTDKGTVDASGFGANGQLVSNTKVWKWKYINTDKQNLERTSGYMFADKNQPIYKAKAVPPTDYLPNIIKGFSTVLQWTLTNKTLFSLNNPFEVFKNKKVRIIPRYTQNYKSIEENSYIPEAVEAQQSRKSIIQKYLNQFPLELILNTSQKKRLIQYECDAIERMDIPYFTCNTSKTDLIESDRLAIKNYYQKTPYDYVMGQIQVLDQEKIDDEIAIIKSSFDTRYTINDSFDTKPKNDLKINSKAREISLPETVQDIASKIINQAHKSNSNYVWNTFISMGDEQSYFDTLEKDIYSGTLGIAFFLSAIDKYQKTEKYQETIDAIVNSKLKAIFKNNTLSPTEDISFSTGISGLIYTLLKIDSEKYKTEIVKLTHLISKKTILNDSLLDIMGGSAGILIVLCNVYRTLKSNDVLERIQFIADNLLKKRIVDTKTGYRIWITIKENVALTGFSHGVSGIAYALLNVFEITKNESYKDAFYEAINYEDYYYNQDKKNWQDLRNTEENVFQNMWCHGASGIGMSRLYAYKTLKDKRFIEDIPNIVEATKKNSK